MKIGEGKCSGAGLVCGGVFVCVGGVGMCRGVVCGFVCVALPPGFFFV